MLKDWYKENGYHPVTVKVAKTLKHQIDAAAKEKKVSQRIFLQAVIQSSLMYSPDGPFWAPYKAKDAIALRVWVDDWMHTQLIHIAQKHNVAISALVFSAISNHFFQDTRYVSH